MTISDRTAMIWLETSKPCHVLFITRAAAKLLHSKGLLQKIEGRAAYCAPRSWRQIAHGITPPLHREVLNHSYLTPKEALNAQQSTRQA